ncbi:TIGR02679 domain-containing protein, partial [Frankia sp. AiPs1]|uniref:TIGR02679 domain-containing protein n=1 Tax=Frankia sp. AiPs1 TaxID=573493 RepID=UPI002043352A
AAVLRREESRRRRAALDMAVEAHLATIPGPARDPGCSAGRTTGCVAGWPAGWRDAAWSDGLFAGRAPDEVAGLVRTVAAVLAHTGSGLSRGEIAARECGDAHALDSSTRLTALVTRALVARDGPAGERAAWERAGIPLDLVSAPVLTWALPLLGDSAAASAARAMTAAGLPLHLTVLAL